jgi:hypothetical protein
MDPNLPGIFITDPNIPAQEADHMKLELLLKLPQRYC